MAQVELISVASFADPRRTGEIRELEGPWQGEPDKAQWIAHDLDCLAVRNHFGAWCGYVGVPPGHPHHGAYYDDVDVDVHGGLTFAARCAPGEPATGICHVPQPGRPDDVWWLGFDCGHAWDLQPRMLKHTLEIPAMQQFRHLHEQETYRDFAYIVAETTRLAAQLAKPALSM